MSNAERILRALDTRLDGPVELTLYGRAALQLGFTQPLEEFAWSKDVDGILWLGQAETLAATTRFWDAVREARIPDIEEIREQFAVCSEALLRDLAQDS